MLTQKRASLFFSLSSSASAPPRGSSRASSPCAAACPRRMTTTMPSGTWAPGARPPPWALLVRGKGAEERRERPAAPCATWAGLRLHPLRSLVHPFVWRECAGPSVCCEAMVDAVPKLEEAGEGAAGYRDLETGRAVFAAGSRCFSCWRRKGCAVACLLRCVMRAGMLGGWCNVPRTR